MLAPVLALALQSSTSDKAPLNGDFLYSACKVYVQMADHETLTGPPFSGGYCMGLIVGLTDALGVEKIICTGETKYETIARVSLLYMDKNPRVRDEIAEVGMVKALKDGYPCSTK